MMNHAEVAVSALFFGTVIILSLGIPLVRAFSRRQDRTASATPLTPELAMRLDRLEAIVETIAVEVERLSEGQRFTTRLLSEGVAHPRIPQARDAAPQAAFTEVTHV
jgi:hypothetical protein